MKEHNDTPPRLAAWLARLCLHEVDADAVLGDLEETYLALYQRYGKAAARRWYWGQVLRSIPHLAYRTIYWSLVMLKNYMLIAFRNLRRHAGYSLLNVLGLALGIACCILVFLYVRHELSYDTFHDKGDRIHRVSMPEWNLAYLPRPLGPVLEEGLPSVVHTVRFFDVPGRFVQRGDNLFAERVTFTDPGVFDMFSFPLVAGNPASALTELNAVVITEALALKYFGDEDPLGQPLSLRLFSSTYEDFLITGVVGALPGPSSIEFDILLPMEKYRSTVGEEVFSSWSSFSSLTFVELTPQADADALEADLSALIAQHAGRTRAYGLDPLSSIHFRSAAIYSYVLSGIGLIVLLIACINFMTLTMGQAATRAREIGMRKVLGAARTQLAGQFWGEALLMSGLALVLGVGLAALFLPTFNRLAEKNLVLDVFSNAPTMLALAGLVLLVGLVVGSYPALVLSRLHPVEVIRNRLRLSGRSTLTRSLVVSQFACSVMLIVCTLIMSKQLDYMQTKDLGLNHEQVVGFPANADLLEVFRNELATHSAIVNLTGTSYTTNRTGTRGSEDLSLNGSDTLDVVHYRVDYDYLKTLDIDLLAGRSFSRDRGTDATEAALVNETFVNAFGLDAANAVGTQVGEITIIGVVEDFHFRSLHEEIPPLILNLHVYPVHYILARISPDDMRTTMAHIEATWQNVAPNRPFDYFFLDEDIDQLYRAEERWRSIIRYASFGAILVACLGLFGLATLTTTRRTKEIGIRKVLGASVPGILNLLSKEFLKLVLVANVIAWPMAYVAMRLWLRNFAYRIDLEPGVFLLAGLLALLMVLLTVSYQAIRTALTDPVKTLRYE